MKETNKFFLAWLLANILAVIIGLLIAFALSNIRNFLITLVISLLSIGLVFGYFQYFVLKKFVPIDIKWIFANIIGYGVGATGYIFVFFRFYRSQGIELFSYNSIPETIFLVGAAGGFNGLLVGVLQGSILRNILKNFIKLFLGYIMSFILGSITFFLLFMNELETSILYNLGIPNYFINVFYLTIGILFPSIFSGIVIRNALFSQCE